MPDYDQLLDDFLDGTPLEYPRELDLFAELHRNENLRNDLRGSILLLRNAGLDVAAHAPPAQLTSTVFSRLGFMEDRPGRRPWAFIPGSASGVLGTHGLRWAFGGFLLGAVTALAVLLVAGSGTFMRDDGAADIGSAPAYVLMMPTAAGAAYGLGTTGRLDGNAGASTAVDAQSLRTAAPAGIRDAASETKVHFLRGARNAGMQTTSTSIDRRNAVPRRNGSRPIDTWHEAPHTLETPRTTFPQRDIPRNDSGNTRVQLADPDISNDLGIRPLLRVDRTGRSTTDERTPVPLSSGVSPLDDLLAHPTTLPLSLVVRGLSSRNVQTVPTTLSERVAPSLGTGALGVYYHLDEQQWIGVEAGQETYYQRFTELLPSGNRVLHEQTPVLFWAGLGYRWSIDSPSGLQPFAQGILGGTPVGPMARGAVGTQYQLSPPLGVFACFEASAAGYHFGDTWFVSAKYGVTYGITLTY